MGSPLVSLDIDVEAISATALFRLKSELALVYCGAFARSGANQRSLIDAFELVELADAPHHQRHGIGGRLHDVLIDDPSARRAWLLTNPAALGARALYRKRGWCELGRPVLADRAEPGLVLARAVDARGRSMPRLAMGVGKGW